MDQAPPSSQLASATGFSQTTIVTAGGGVGSWTQLFDSSHIAGPQANFDVTIPNPSSTLLVVELLLRSDVAAGFDAAQIQFDGQTGAAYSYITSLITAGATTVAQAALATAIVTPLMVPAATATANCFGSLCVEVPYFANSVTYKEVRMRGAGTKTVNAGDQASFTGSGFLANSVKFSRVTVLPLNGANWVANSRCVVWSVT